MTLGMEGGDMLQIEVCSDVVILVTMEDNVFGR